MSISDKIETFLERKLGITEEQKRRIHDRYKYQIKLQEDKEDLTFYISRFDWFVQFAIMLLLVISIHGFISFIDSDESDLQMLAIMSLICASGFLYEIILIQILKTKKIVFSKNSNTFKIPPTVFGKKAKRLDLIKDIYIVEIGEFRSKPLFPKLELIPEKFHYEVNLECDDKRRFYNISTEKTYEDAKKIGTIIADYLNLELTDYVK